MKKVLSIALLVLLGLSLIVAHPTYSYARGGHGAGWFVGGLALGTILGSSVRPYYYGPSYVYPAPVYVYPRPAYVYPGPVYVTPEVANRAYAYPDPAYSARDDAPAGEWVTVPGQWVEGRWVPQHKVWVQAKQ